MTASHEPHAALSAIAQPTIGQLRLNRSSLRNSALASAVVLGTAGALPAAAQQQAPAGSTQLPAISVEGQQPEESYKVDHSASPKFTAPLLDTPKTVTIIPQEVMQERGVTSLIEVLRTTPGITLGSGEGGTPVGDRPFIRGFEASTDIFVDGIRDLGRIGHESFNLEQIEVTKGPGSTFTGRGSTGGSINMVSKTPKAENFLAGSVAFGTDMTKRATIDGNYLLTDNIAMRLNLMGHDGEVASRDDQEIRRWGFAPSVTLGLNNPTRVTLSYYHLDTDDSADLGIPMDQRTGKPIEVDRSNFYGFKNRDYKKTRVDTGTLEISHDLTDDITLRNITRYGWSNNDYIITRPTYHIPSGMVNRDGRSRNSDSHLLINQTDLTGELETGFIKHNYIVGLEYSSEEVRNRAYNTPASTRADLHNPNSSDPFGQPITIAGGASNPTKTEAKSAYLIDTAKLTDQWEVNLGLRFDNYEVQSGTLKGDYSFFNYQAGLVYKPAPNGSVYIAYGTSSNPSGETEGQSGGADGAAGGGLAGKDKLDPEKNRSYELGTKWDVLERKLALTAAIFRTEKTNQRANDPATGTVQLIGNSKADGAELGFSGNITPEWKVFGGYTYIKARLVDDGAGTNDGKVLKFTAPHSFSLWTTYDLFQDFTIGGGAYYMGRRYLDDVNSYKFAPYWRFDAMAAYRLTKDVSVQLNVMNLTDEDIYDASHVGLFANVAPGRSALLTTNFKF